MPSSIKSSSKKPSVKSPEKKPNAEITMENLSEKLHSVDSELKIMNSNTTSSLATIFEELKPIRTSLEFLSKQWEEAKGRLQAAENKIISLTKDNLELKDTTTKMREENRDLKLALNNLEQYGRRDCIEIKGVAVQRDECTDALVVGVAKQLGVTITKADISVSHRLKNYNSNSIQQNLSSDQDQSQQQNNSPPTIIAKFISRKTRDQLMKNKHKIDRSKRIYINESLTKENRRIFNICLHFKKNNSYKFIWTQNGKTLLKKDVDSPTIMIANDEDLKKIIPPE